MPVVRLSLALLFLAGTAAPGAQDRLGDSLPEGAVQRLGTARFRYPSGIGDLCYTPDGRGLIAVGKSVEVWDLEKGLLVEARQIAQGSIVGLQPSADGKRVLIADSNGTFYEWDLLGNKAAPAVKVGHGSFRAAHYSPDETRVLTTGGSPPVVKEFSLETAEELISIRGQMHSFSEAIYGPDGLTALVDGENGSGPVLAHYDLRTGELLNAWVNDYYAHARSLVLSADQTRVLIGSRHSATEWLLDGYKELGKFSGHSGHAVTSVAYCADPKQLLTGSRDGSIRRWDRGQVRVLLRWCPHQGHVTRIRVSPEGRWVLSYGANTVAESDIETGAARVDWARHRGAVNAVAVVPGTSTAVTASSDATLRLWNVQSGEPEGLIEGLGLGAYALDASPDGGRMAAGCKDGVIREYRIATREQLRELSGHLGYVRAVRYAPNGDLLSAAGDGTIRVWGPEGTEPRQVLRGHRGGVLAIAVSRDGGRLVSGGRDGTVRLWDLRDGSLVSTLTGHRGWVHSLALSPDGAHALSGARDGRVLKWDLAQGTLAGETHLGGRAAALAVDAEGRHLYAGGTDGSITRIEMATMGKGAVLSGHEGDVLAIALSPHGGLVSAGADTTALVWPVGQ
jgi:WD40 repeat protein